MSDRHRGYIVALEEDIHESDSKKLVAVLKSLRGVADVTPVVTGAESYIADMRARMQVRDKLIALYEDFK